MFLNKIKRALIVSLLCASPFAMANEKVNVADGAELAQAAAAVALVNVNSADAATLAAKLKGIGLVKAEAIVAYRSEFGPFKTANDLSKVKGIGERTVAKFASQLSF